MRFGRCTSSGTNVASHRFRRAHGRPIFPAPGRGANQAATAVHYAAAFPGAATPGHGDSLSRPDEFASPRRDGPVANGSASVPRGAAVQRSPPSWVGNPFLKPGAISTGPADPPSPPGITIPIGAGSPPRIIPMPPPERREPMAATPIIPRGDCASELGTAARPPPTHIRMEANVDPQLQRCQSAYGRELCGGLPVRTFHEP